MIWSTADTRRTNRGVHISERPLPHLLPDTTEADWFIDGVDEAALSPKMFDGIVLFKDKKTKNKMLSDVDSRVHGRQILGSVKRVYGAAFSGYLEESVDNESAVVDAMVFSAASCEWNHSKTVKASHLKLRRSAEKVVARLHQLLDAEIGVHLGRITKRLLDNKATLSWHLVTNNCQRLVDTLLKGNDFEYTFPRLPKDFGSRPRDAEGRCFGWPRYLISFGDRLDGQHYEGQQLNSIISTFCQRQRHQCDLIDHIELIPHRLQDDRNNRVHESEEWHELRLAPNRSGGADLTKRQPDMMMFDKLWELPRDTLSVLQSHLLRPTHRYRSCDGRIVDEGEWIENRLRLIRQLYFFSIFAGGLGAALLDILHREPSVLSRVHIPKSHVFGTVRADEKVKVIRFTSRHTAYIIRNRHSPELSVDSAGLSKLAASLEILRKVSSYNMFNWMKVNIEFPSLQLMRQKLYGRREWMSLTLPNNTVVMMQVHEKDKAVR